MINVQFLDMPGRTKAVCTQNDDYSYTIFLNSRLSYEQNLKSFKHEIKHIINEDHAKYDVDKIEKESR